MTLDCVTVDRAAAFTNCSPTPRQAVAGNYRKGRFRIRGLNIVIENPAWSVRKKIRADGSTAWAVTMPAHYGYVRGTLGADGDAVDVFVGPYIDSKTVFVIDQVHPETGVFDEHKCMVGWHHLADAMNAYRRAYPDGKADQRIGSVTAMGIDEFREWAKSPGATERLAKADPEDLTGKKLVSLADTLESRLAAGIAGVLNWMGSKVVSDSVTAAAATMDADAAAEAVPTTLDKRLDTALAPVDVAIAGGARVAADRLARTGGGYRLDFSFDVRNPRVTDYINEYRLDLIREMTEGQREAIRTIVSEAVTNGVGPADTARKIREGIGLTAIQAGHVEAYRKALETLEGSALQRGLRDRRFDRTVAKAILAEKPLDAEVVDKMVDAYRRRYIAYRSTTIARTESMRAVNAGNRMVLEIADDEGSLQGYRVIKKWIATKDGRTRDAHRELDGQEVTGMDNPFILRDGRTIKHPHDPDAPPELTINCRCAESFRLVPQNRFGDA